MKQRFTLIIATLLLCVYFPFTASAYDVEVGGIYYNIIPNVNTAEVTSGDKEYTGEITIPETISVDEEVYKVTSIGKSAFYISGLTSITIPNSVTSIGGSAFRACSSLTSITIPSTVTSIGGHAFAGCSSLTSITIPNLVTSIGNNVFEGCSRITSITIPNSVTSIGDYAFTSCSSLTSITIPNLVTSIGIWAFAGCSSLTSIAIPNSVTSIGFDAFDGCSSLTSITISNSLTSINSYTFRGCSSLTSITIPNSVTKIGEYALSGCSSLTSITIPNSVTTIGSCAFQDCSILTSVTLPNSLTSIGGGAFYTCKKIENVYCYAETVPNTGLGVFSGSYIEYATLHVPGLAIDAYKTTEPWSGFGTLKILEGTEVETKKCETPTISFVEGELVFNCATEDVEYVSEIKSEDINKFYTEKVKLSACYDISVTAMKTGYDNSDIATAKLYWLPSSATLESTNINRVSMRGITVQSVAGFITISGLDNNETVSFYGVDGKSLGMTKAMEGTVQFSAQPGTMVVAKIGGESVKIAVK